MAPAALSPASVHLTLEVVNEVDDVDEVGVHGGRKGSFGWSWALSVVNPFFDLLVG